jgi:hypothetical protein
LPSTGSSVSVVTSTFGSFGVLGFESFAGCFFAGSFFLVFSACADDATHAISSTPSQCVRTPETLARSIR